MKLFYKLILTFLLAVAGFTSQAYDFQQDGIYYDIDVENRGAIVTFGSNPYTGEVTIPETVTYNNYTLPVTQIGPQAFYNCENLLSIQLPETILSIGDYAFSKCINLERVVIPESVKTIGDYSFSECDNLEFIHTGHDVEVIGEGVFYKCYNLIQVTLNESLSIIGEGAFFDCDLLCVIDIPLSVTSIGKYAFYGCNNLPSLIIPPSVIYLGDYFIYPTSSDPIYPKLALPEKFSDRVQNTYAYCVVYPDDAIIMGYQIYSSDMSILYFYNSPVIVIDNFTVPDGVKIIGDLAFFRCNGVRNYTLPESLTTIGNHAFTDCYILSSIEIPSSVTKIGNEAFGSCISLKNIKLSSSLTEIGAFAFYGCTSLLSIEIPNNVTTINEQLFCNCENLSSVKLPESLITIEREAFRFCSSLSTIKFPSSLSSIGDYAFELSGLESIDLGTSVETIGNYAFAHNKLVSLKIPKSVNLIRDGAFNTNRLETIVFEDGESVLEFSRNSAFSNNNRISNVYFGRDMINYPLGEYQFKKVELGETINNADFFTEVNTKYMKSLYSFNLNPPILNDVFPNTQYANLPVYVPEKSTDLYLNADVWKNFWNLHGVITENGIIPYQITLDQDYLEMSVGQQSELEATVLPEETTDKTIIWSSSDEKVAIVSENGLVTAVSEGDAIITATCGEVSAECKITVLENSSVESLLANPDTMITIYSTGGILIKKDCRAEDLKSLNKGIYIIVSGKERYKIKI